MTPEEFRAFLAASEAALFNQATAAIDAAVRAHIGPGPYPRPSWRKRLRYRIEYRVDRLLQPIHDRLFSRYCDIY